MKHFTLVLLLTVYLLLASACAKSPEYVLLDSFDDIESIMRDNVEDPDTLIQKLNEYSAAHHDDWQNMINKFETIGEENVTRALDQHQERLRQTLLNIVNLDLEIQDRLQDDPVRMTAYQKAIHDLSQFRNYYI